MNGPESEYRTGNHSGDPERKTQDLRSRLTCVILSTF